VLTRSVGWINGPYQYKTSEIATMSCRLHILAIIPALVTLLLMGEATSIAADSDPPSRIDPLPTTIDATCQERFLKEAVPAWKQLRERLRGIELDLTWADHYPDDEANPDPPPTLSTYCILKDGVSRRHERASSIEVTNSRYSFRVRQGEIPILKYCELWQPDSPQPMAGWLDGVEFILAMGSNMFCMPIAKMVADDDFQMTGADWGVNNTGDEAVRVVYRYMGKASEEDLMLQPENVFWAELLPSRFWLVSRSGMTSSKSTLSLPWTPFEVSVTTRFQEWNGTPLPERSRIEWVDLRKNVITHVRENRFGPPRDCVRPIGEFFLPHYGFPEDPLPSIADSCEVP
jgi:hypothetical protein